MLGEPLFWIGLSLITLLVYWFTPNDRRGIRLKFMLIVLPAAGLTYGITLFLKDFLAIPRPCMGLSLCPSDFSMPSTHSAVAFASMGFLGYLTTHLVLILALILAVSRVAEGVHTWPDVIVGAAIGLIMANLVYKVYEKEFRKDKDGDKNRKRRDKDTRNR